MITDPGHKEQDEDPGHKEQDEDPGLIIIYDTDANIHNCLGLPTVGTVAGAWGSQPWHIASPKNMFRSLVYLCVHVWQVQQPCSPGKIYNSGLT